VELLAPSKLTGAVKKGASQTPPWRKCRRSQAPYGRDRAGVGRAYYRPVLSELRWFWGVSMQPLVSPWPRLRLVCTRATGGRRRLRPMEAASRESPP
jgi:hypothetical protein